LIIFLPFTYILRPYIRIHRNAKVRTSQRNRLIIRSARAVSLRNINNERKLPIHTIETLERMKLLAGASSLSAVLVSCIHNTHGSDWIDPDTPESKQTTTSFVDGSIYNLVSFFALLTRSLKELRWHL